MIVVAGVIPLRFDPSHGPSISCVYSADKVHPSFVTAIAFLSPPGLSHQAMSYPLVSVSVDQRVCLHRGPSVARVGNLARGLPDPECPWQRCRRHSLRAISWLGCLLLVVLAPVGILCLDWLLQAVV